MSNIPFVLANALIFTGNDFVEEGYVHVQDGVIKEVKSGPYTCADECMAIIDCKGQTILPGLIDSHVHGLKGNVLAIEQPLRFGVTTVCDMHNETAHIATLKRLAHDPDSKLRYSDFKCAGTGAIVNGGWPGPVVRLHGETPETKAMIDSWPNLQSPSEAAPFVAQQILQNGAEYIKLFHELGDSLRLPVSLPRPPLDLQQAVVEAAHAHGIRAVGHAFSYEGTMELLRAGVDGLTHIFFDRPKSDEYITLCKRNNVHVNPTLSTCASQTRDGEEMQRKFAADPLAQKALFDPTPRMQLGMAAEGNRAETAFECTRALYRAGVPIIVGSDSSGQARGTAYGLGVHMEIYLLVHECGLSIKDALKGATSLIADRFGFNDRGRLAPGKKADLVLVDGDVRKCMADPTNLCLPVTNVWRDGVQAEFWQSQGNSCGSYVGEKLMKSE